MKNGSLNVVDRCILAYHALVLLLVLLFHSRIPHWPGQAALCVGIIAVVFLMARGIGDRPALPAALLRNLYPLALFLPMYMQTGQINHVVFREFLDPLFQRVEAAVFGFEPAVVFARSFPQKWFAEYMHFAYWSYYLLFPGLGLFLFFRRSRAELRDYLFSLCCTMSVCCLSFIVLPIRGALSYELGDAPGRGPFSAIMAVIYRHFEIDGGAFPSSHVAVAACVLYYTFRQARAAVWFVGPLAVSLMLSTVYCRYHYAIDVLAGLATAVFLIPLWRRINPERHGQEGGTTPPCTRDAGISARQRPPADPSPQDRPCRRS